MDKNAIWKWLILVLLVAGSLVLVTPYKKKIRLGLDLRGGTSFAVRVDESEVERDVRLRDPSLDDDEVEKQVRDIMRGSQDRALEVIRNRVDKLGIEEPTIYPGKDGRIMVQLPGTDAEDRREAEESIRSVAFLEFRMVHERNEELVGELFEKGLAPDGYRIRRIDTDTYYVRDKTALKDSAMDAAYRDRLGRYEVPDAGYEFMLEAVEVKEQKAFRPAFVKRRRELSGEYLDKAWVDLRGTGQSVVKIKFDSKGAKKFASITKDYAPGGPRNPNPDKYRQLGIVLDGTLYSAPIIRDAIYGGRAEITGQFKRQEATQLANVLSAGSLPAPVEIVEKRFVAPSLGRDSVRSGVRAVVLGGIGVLVFMAAYYLLCGVIADLALALNMVLLPLGMVVAAGCLSVFGRDAGGGAAIQLPVLTLPGIAGILLTIGMAVDANVLIFERIREESGVGKRLWTAITAGYDRAFLTIIDANLTTLLTGIILFIFGSGPIRGFAVTLCAGILVSMFTALVVTKLFFGVLASHTKIKTLKMLSILKKTSIDFVAQRKVAALGSLILIVLTWGFMFAAYYKDPGRVFGVDFLGGASLTFNFEQREPVVKVRSAIQELGVTEVHVQYQEEIEAGGDSYLLVKVGAQDIDGKQASDLVKQELPVKLSTAKLTLAQEDEVGPQVGTELKRRAVWAIVWALLGIIVYISVRFELGFAVGAIAALVHDVLVTVGLYSLFGRQLSLPIVAALLTIVGYSVNDTIVVFDRIREDLRLVRNKSFKEICNLSINQTLSRTLLTSLTTLITVVMLLVFGGGAIHDFALALCIGVLVGTYSSIFVATPVVLLWHRDKKPEFASRAK